MLTFDCNRKVTDNARIWIVMTIAATLLSRDSGNGNAMCMLWRMVPG